MKKMVFLTLPVFLIVLFCACDPIYTQDPVLRPDLNLTYIVPEPGAAELPFSDPGYAAGTVAWTDISTVDPVNHVDVENFIIGHVYKARLTLYANSNYSFSRLEDGAWDQSMKVPSTTNFYHTGAKIVEQSNNTGDTIDIEITFPSAKERSYDPEEGLCAMTAINGDATEVNFSLSKRYTGVWKVYDTGTGVTPSSVVSASYIDVGDKHILTLKSASLIPAKTWYVTITEPDKLESEGRLALWGKPLTLAEHPAPMSLAERFRIPETALSGGSGGPAAVFNLLHDYMNDPAVRARVNAANNYAIPGIALGDWVDLQSLTVSAYDSAGGFSVTTNDEVPGHGRLLRLMVVGNNSFNSDRAKAIDEQYGIFSYDAYNPADDIKTHNNGTPHLVFQFQNLFGSRRMDGTSTHRCYYDCDIRTYLNDKYLTGLAAAGLPADYLFAPIQYSLKNDGNSSEWITDKVWLPTMRQLFWNDTWALTRPSPSAIHHREFPEYQPRLEYYTDNESRIKGKLATDTDGYFTWTASTPDNNGKGLWVFNASTGSITATSADIHDADDGTPRVCPAFCVW